MYFEDLLKKIAPTLKRITYKLNRHYSFLSSEDLYQEALLHLWQDFQKGKLEDKTDSYILQGCYFHLKNHLRKVSIRNRTISLAEISSAEEINPQESALLEDERCANYREQLDNRMLAETIRNNGLTDREKYILSMCTEGLTTRQMGGRLGVTHVSVVKAMARIRKKCLKYLC